MDVEVEVGLNIFTNVGLELADVGINGGLNIGIEDAVEY